MLKDWDLFFLCALIEYTGREYHLSRKDVANSFGLQGIRHIYQHAGVLHCLPIEQACDEQAAVHNIRMGTFDNISTCKYTVPDFWDIADVYEMLIQNVHSQSQNTLEEDILTVFNSWLIEKINNFNTALYYQTEQYLFECYKAGYILE